MAIIKVYKQQMLESVWRKGNPLTLLVGILIGTTTMENSMEVPRKTKNRSTIWSSNPTPGLYPEKTIIQIDTCTPVLTEKLFTIAKTWKQSKCPSTEEWIKKTWFTYTMEYYSAIEKNEIMPFSATWMNLEIIIVSEVSHSNILTCGI